MATIFYSLMGEGRGHAARALTMIEQLRERHRIVVYTSHDALAFLRGHYGDDTDIEFREIEGMKFFYSGGRINLTKSIAHGLGIWWRKNKLLRPILADFDREKPDLLITDWEPLLARGAQRANVSILSLDHQHFLAAYDLSELPRSLRLFAWSMSWSVWAFGIGQDKTVISAFYKPPLRPDWKSAIQVGPLLRPNLRSLVSENRGYVLSYLRKHTPESVVDALTELDLPIRVYGLGPRPPQGEQMTFHEIDEASFSADLAACDCVIAAAGNQLLGESLYFGKPTLALPEELHHEQRMNAHFLKQLGGGDWVYLEEATAEKFTEFVEARETFRENLAGRAEEFDGTSAAVDAVESMLTSPADI